MSKKKKILQISVLLSPGKRQECFRSAPSYNSFENYNLIIGTSPFDRLVPLKPKTPV